ncbi:hypothetical protein [Serinicoccus sediminis]|uniref:hypothetical protein n=1 Tax=Serinicoccus sediminis TaxID=2306021 RepID=UPI0013ED558B|nr:hypothetical protein [Serinicoccus sediminis]
MAIGTPTLLATYQSTANVTTGQMAVGVAVPAGEVVVVTAHAGGAADLAIGDSKGNTWAAGPLITQATAPGSTTRIFTALITEPLEESDTITVARAGSGGLVWHALRITGASGAVGSSVTNTGTTATIATGAVPSAAGNMVIIAATSAASATLTGSTGTTVIGTGAATGGNSNRSGWAAHRLSTDNNPVTPTVTMNNGYAWSAAAVELVAAPTAPGQTGDYEVVRRVGGVTTVLDVVRRAGGVTTVLELVADGGTSPEPATALTGLYYGTVNATTDPVANTQSGFGVTPQLVSAYLQWGENFDLTTQSGTDRLNMFKAVIDAGTAVYLTVQAKDGAPHSYNDIAGGNTAALARLQKWCEFVQALADYSPQQTYIGMGSEFEVQVNQGLITGVSNQTFAQAHDLFCTYARQHAPDCRTVYHVGHFDATAILEILGHKQVGMDVMGLDPYRGGGGNPSTTVRQMMNGKNLTPANVRSNTNIIRLGNEKGSPVAVALTEYGTDRSYTDSSIAGFISSTQAAIDAEDLEFTIYWNSDSGPNNNSRVDVTGYDLSRAALAALVSI